MGRAIQIPEPNNADVGDVLTIVSPLNADWRPPAGGGVGGGGTPGAVAVWVTPTDLGDDLPGADTIFNVPAGQQGVFALNGVSLVTFGGAGLAPTVNGGVASGDALHVWANVYGRSLISDVGLLLQADSKEALAFVVGAAALNASLFGGPTADFAGGDGVVQLAPAATAPSAAPADAGAVLLWTAVHPFDSIATLNVALNNISDEGYLVIGTDAAFDPGIGYELFSSPGDRYGLISRANGPGGVYLGYGVLGGSPGATADYIAMYIRSTSPSDVLLYWDDTLAFPYLGTAGRGEADLGVVGQEWRDLHLVGQIKQKGTDGAAAGVVVFTNAPTSNVVQYMPAMFDSGAGLVAGWIPFIPASP